MSSEKITEGRVEYTVVTYPEGTTRWIYKGYWHREKGPAVYNDDEQQWWLNGKLVYCNSEDFTANFDLTDEMKMQIIKYKLTR